MVPWKRGAWTVAGAATLGLLWPCNVAPGDTRGTEFTQAGGAANPPTAAPPASVETLDWIFPIERQVAQQIRVAQGLIQGGRFAEGVGILGAILQVDEDHYLPLAAGQTTARSAKSEALRLMLKLPRAGLEAIELQFGAEAARELGAGVEQRDYRAIEDVARRYPLTQAGYEAAWLLARHALEENRTGLARTYLERLWNSPACDSASSAESPLGPLTGVTLAVANWRDGDREKALEILATTKERFGNRVLLLSGSELRWYETADQAGPWLERLAGPPASLSSSEEDVAWTMHRGGPARNTTVRGGRFLLAPRWRLRAGTNPDVQKALAGLTRMFLDTGQSPATAIQPIAVGEVIVTRTIDRLIAVSLQTGKRVWEVEPLEEDTFGALAKADRSEEESDPDGIDVTSQLAAGLEQRVWDDMTFGTLASDGERVYSIEGLDFALTETLFRPRMIAPSGEELIDDAAPTNRLAARELRSEGRLAWEVGGESGGDEPALAGSFFLGPPLVLDGSLYVLLERQNEIRLSVLDAQTGRLAWSQALALVEENIGFDSVRRLAGTSPSYDAGVLVCPTAAGAVVGIDLTSRSVRWGFAFPHDFVPVRRMSRALQGTISGPAGMASQRGWLDSSPTIAQGRALLTPSEFPAILCLDLFSGELAWQQEIRDRLYVACVHGQSAVMVCQRRVESVRLDDGSRQWELQLPEGSLPTGRGFYNPPFYFLPLSSAEVLQVCLDDGTLVRRLRSRTGEIPGNLVCFHDHVISQGPTHLEVFYQLDPLARQVTQRLSANPEDPWALMRRGQIAWEDNRLDDAIRDFRQALSIYQQRMRGPLPAGADGQQGPETVPPDNLSSVDWNQLLREEVLPDFAGWLEARELLLAGILSGLESDFAKHRDALGELDALAPTPEQRLAAWRFASRGWQELGEWSKAVAALAEVIPAAEESTFLERVGPRWEVRRDRWVRGRMRDVLDAPGDQDAARRAVLELAGRHLERARASGSIRAWRTFLDYFGDSPLADTAGRKLVELYLADDRRLECEALLESMRQCGRDETQRYATAHLARLYFEWGRVGLSADLFKQLQAKWPEVACWNAKTPRQLIDELPPDSLVARAISGRPLFPAGAVETENQRSIQREAMQPVRLHATAAAGHQGAPWTRLVLERQRGELVARDEFGRPAWRIPLRSGRSYSAARLPRGPEASAFSHGHLLLFWSGGDLIAVDGLREAAASSPALRWTNESRGSWSSPRQRSPARGPRNPLGLLPEPSRPTSWFFAEPSLVAGDLGVFYQREGQLVCADALTGRLVWRRSGLTGACWLFGDEEVLIVVPPESREGRVFRAVDGRDLGTCRMPREQEVLRVRGRTLLTLRQEPRDVVRLSLVDPWLGKDIWSRDIATASRACFVGANELAIVRPEGAIELVDLADGCTRVQAAIDPPRNLALLHVFHELDRLYVLVCESARNTAAEPRLLPDNSTVQITPYPPGPWRGESLLVDGLLYGVDRHTGQPLWNEPTRLADCGLIAEQAEWSPVLLFAHGVQRTIPPGETTGGRRPGVTHTLGILCVDKQTGRIVHRDDRLSPGNGLPELEVVPDEAEVRISMPSNTVVLRFTGQPWPADTGQGPPAWDGFSRGLRGLFEVFRRDRPLELFGVPTFWQGNHDAAGSDWEPQGLFPQEPLGEPSDVELELPADGSTDGEEP